MTTATTNALLPLTDHQNEVYGAYRALALAQMPYFASIITAFRPVNAPGLGTWACDPKMRLYVDFDAVEAEGPVAGGESILHEAMHIFGADAAFAADLGITDPTLARAWNLATDAAHNDDLRDAGCTIFVDGGQFVLPSSLGQPDYQTAQHYFEHLRTAINRKRQQPGRRRGHGQPGAQGQPGTASTPGAGDEPYRGCGSGAGAPAAPCELGDDDLGGAAPAATDVEVVRIRVATAAAIQDHAAKGRGTVPGGLATTAEQVLTPPKVPWQRTLGRLVRSARARQRGTAEETYNVRNRRRHNDRILTPHGPGSRIIVPAKVDPIPCLWVVRDTSASVDDGEQAEITSEIVGISKQLRVRSDNLVIVDVDAAVHASQKFTGAKSLATITGRGGTNMVVGIEHAWDAHPRPTAIVVMTDGETPWPAHQRSRIPVIACLYGPTAHRGAASVPSWIKTVIVD